MFSSKNWNIIAFDVDLFHRMSFALLRAIFLRFVISSSPRILLCVVRFIIWHLYFIANTIGPTQPFQSYHRASWKASISRSREQWRRAISIQWLSSQSLSWYLPDPIILSSHTISNHAIIRYMHLSSRFCETRPYINAIFHYNYVRRSVTLWLINE